MSYVKRHVVSVTTNASGDATAYSDELATGVVRQVRYIPDGSTPLATGADVTITGEASGVVVLNQTNIGTSAYTVTPRQATHDTAGAASLYAAGGEPVEDGVAVAQERLKLVVAQGGDTKIGQFHIYVG